MCPAPSWNKRNNLLTIYVKCGDKEKFPCTTVEEKIKQCKKATVKIKPKTITKNTTFEDLIFF